jgi:hypothetical protein
MSVSADPDDAPAELDEAFADELAQHPAHSLP